MNIRTLTLVCGVSAGLLSTQAWALFGNNNNKLEQRIARLEQMQQQGSQGDLVMQLERLQQEIQQLRGELEIQGHALDAMKRRQNDLYQDVDQRLNALGGNAGQAGAAAQPAGAPPLQINSRPMQNSAMGIDASAPMTAPPAQTADPHQEAAYQASFDQLKKGEYQNAAKSFKSFLSAYPRGAYADKAQYWLGESYYVMQNYKDSLAEYGKLVKNYPYSGKIPDALLKMSYIHYEGKNWGKARSLLSKITKEHQGSTAAVQATKRLDMMREKGH